jgi:hypothetical protein
LEVLEHSIEHLKNGSEKDMKFAVLHADNAVELILKELARVKGIRLITRKGQSIGYYECVEKLKVRGVTIPELPDVDILHSERNLIYHLGNMPDRLKSEWLVYDVALKLIERVSKDEFSYDINAFSKQFKLSQAVRSEIELTKSEITNKYLKDAHEAFDSEMFDACVLLSYIGLEAFLREGIPLDLSKGIEGMEALVADDLISGYDLNDVASLRKIRNKVVHGMMTASKKEAEFALETFSRIVTQIDADLM